MLFCAAFARATYTIKRGMFHKREEKPSVQAQSLRDFFGVLKARFSVCFFGIIAVSVWIQCCFYQHPFSESAQASSLIGSISRAALIVLLIVAFACGHFNEREQKLADWLSVIALTVAAALYVAQNEIPQLPVTLLETLLAGIGIAWGIGMWMRFYERLQPDEALIYTFTCLALSSVINFCMTLMPHVMCYVLCIFLPIVSYVAYHQAMRELDKRNARQMFHVKHNGERNGKRDAAIAAHEEHDGERVATNPTGIIDGAGSAAGAGDATHDVTSAIAAGSITNAASVGDTASNTFTSTPKPVYDAEPISTVIHILAGIALLGFAVGLAGAYPFYQASALSMPLRIVHQVGVCVLSCGLIWWALIHGGGLKFGTMWRFIIGFIIAGVILVALSNENSIALGILLIAIANTFLVGYLWFTAYDYGRHLSMPTYVVLGAVWIVYILPRELGRCVILKLEAFSGLTLLPVIAISFLVVVGIALLLSDNLPHTRPLFADFAGKTAREMHNQSLEQSPERLFDQPLDQPRAAPHAPASAIPASSTNSTPPSTTPSSTNSITPSATLNARCDYVRQHFGLTERETDMVRLLAHGRSKTSISKELFISENTVKSYTRNVYSKLNIHSKQQLLDILDNLTI